MLKAQFQKSMRLKCTARKECIKYIHKSIYLKRFVPNTASAPCGNFIIEIPLNHLDSKGPVTHIK